MFFFLWIEIQTFLISIKEVIYWDVQKLPAHSSGHIGKGGSVENDMRQETKDTTTIRYTWQLKAIMRCYENFQLGISENNTSVLRIEIYWKNCKNFLKSISIAFYFPYIWNIPFIEPSINVKARNVQRIMLN